MISASGSEGSGYKSIQFGHFRHSFKMSLFFLLCLLVLQVSVLGGPSENEEREKCVQEWLRKQPDLLRRFGRAQLGFMCMRSNEWKELAASPSQPVADFLTPKQLEYLGRLRDCQGSDCLRNLGDQNQPSNNLRVNATGIIIDLQPMDGGGDLKVIRIGNQNQMPGGGGDGRAVRKEYRAMNEEERRRYHEAIKRLKADKIDGMSKYDLLVVYHTPQEAPEAHWGPAFLPYHREYLKQYELALRQVDQSVGLPYWDSTLDEGLPDPKSSVLWTSDFMGNGDGPVTSGPCAGWTAVQELANSPGDRRLVRQVGVSPYGGLYKPSDIDFILSRNRYDDLTSCVDPTFELTHGIVHSFVGGYMLDIGISPNDPTFYMHHCFIDYLWEQFRQNRQNPQQRQQDYPTSERSCNEFHTLNAPMKPFNMKNLDGLSERYTNELYRYDQKPTCGQNGECNPQSPYLFCDTRANRCLSKIQLNGNCSGMEAQNSCYKGSCRRGRCVMSDVPEVVITGGTDKPRPPPPITEPITIPTQPFRPVEPPTQPWRPPTQPPQVPTRPSSGGYYYQTSSYNMPIAYITITVVKGYGHYMAQHPNDAIVSVQGLGSPQGYTANTPAAMWPNTTYPSYTGACLVMIYDPDQTNQPVRFSFAVSDANGRVCPLQCWSENQKQYVNCPNGNNFQVMAGQQGDPIPYYRSSVEALEKRWIGSGYQRYRLPDYIVFQCS